MKTMVLAMIFSLHLFLGVSSGSSTMEDTQPQSVTIDWTNQKEPVTHSFVRPDPAAYEKIIGEKETLTRAKVLLSGSTVLLYEKPKDIDFYDSTVEVKRTGQPVRDYNIGELIKHQALSLGHIALVPTSDGSGMLICEYEGGAVGAREGFAILRFSPTGFELHTLPLTDFGKVVVFKSKPEQVEIWSALSDYVGSDADPRFYATRKCQWREEGYVCGPARRMRGRFAPEEINDPGIEIRP